jgi:uncharacterized membrane protein
MNVVNGLPAHVLLVHFMVVLAPLTALLEIACALWPAARKGQLLWLTLILAVVVTVLTPITSNAGGWLYDLRRNQDPVLREHAERGDTMIYFSLALLVVAIALVALHFAERRGQKTGLVTRSIVAIVVLTVGVSSMIQIYRIGDAGAQSVWGNEIARLKKSNGT